LKEGMAIVCCAMISTFFRNCFLQTIGFIDEVFHHFVHGSIVTVSWPQFSQRYVLNAYEHVKNGDLLFWNR